MRLLYAQLCILPRGSFGRQTFRCGWGMGGSTEARIARQPDIRILAEFGCLKGWPGGGDGY